MIIASNERKLESWEGKQYAEHPESNPTIALHCVTVKYNKPQSQNPAITQCCKCRLSTMTKLRNHKSSAT